MAADPDDRLLRLFSNFSVEFYDESYFAKACEEKLAFLHLGYEMLGKKFSCNFLEVPEPLATYGLGIWLEKSAKPLKKLFNQK